SEVAARNGAQPGLDLFEPATSHTPRTSDPSHTPHPSHTAREQGEYRAVTTREQLRELVETLRGQALVSVDTETTSLGRDAQLCGLSLAWRPGEAVYVPVRSPEPEAHLSEAEVLDALRPVLEDEAVPKCGHNLKFDARALLRSG